MWPRLLPMIIYIYHASLMNHNFILFLLLLTFSRSVCVCVCVVGGGGPGAGVMCGFPSLLLAEPWAGLAGYGCSGPLGTRGSKYTPAGLWASSGLPGATGSAMSFVQGSRPASSPALGPSCWRGSLQRWRGDCSLTVLGP